MSRARGGISVTHIATDYPYQVELRDLWGTTPLPLLDLGKAADWIAPKRWYRGNGLLRDGAHVRWAFSVFAEAEAFHARFGGRLVDAADDYPATRRHRGRNRPFIRDILAGRERA